MAASNFSQAPFLTYLTVFKARLGAVTLVLQQVTSAFTPLPTLERKLKATLGGRVPIGLNEVGRGTFIDYLRSKKLIGSSAQKRSRYGEWTWNSNATGGLLLHRGSATDTLLAYQTDLWLSDARLPSTIGLPTPENSAEVIELTQQLRLISRTKNSLTAPGQMVQTLRHHFRPAEPDNPLLLGVDGIAVLRQVIAQDGILMAEILRAVGDGSEQFGRDEIAALLPEIASRAYKKAQVLRFSPPALAEARDFVALLRKTQAKFKGKKGGPGVLEHRTAPRLEWLTDLGILDKAGLPKNGFEYRRTADFQLLASLLDVAISEPYSAEDIAHQYWCRSRSYAALRNTVAPATDMKRTILMSYRMLRRPVGPAPIREVMFLSLILRGLTSDSMSGMTAALIDWAVVERAITLSGGRYTRAPEFVHVESLFLEQNT